MAGTRLRDPGIKEGEENEGGKGQSPAPVAKSLVVGVRACSGGNRYRSANRREPQMLGFHWDPGLGETLPKVVVV